MRYSCRVSARRLVVVENVGNKLLRVLRWILEHVYVKTKDQNQGDPDAKPHTTVEVGVKGTF